MFELSIGMMNGAICGTGIGSVIGAVFSDYNPDGVLVLFCVCVVMGAVIGNCVNLI